MSLSARTFLFSFRPSRPLIAAVLSIGLLVCSGLNAQQNDRSRAAVQDPADNPVNSQPQNQMQILAVVNGQQITRQQVANECLKRFGEEVLQSIISKQLVFRECQRRGIAITNKEVNDELIDRAKKFGMSAERYIDLICSKRNITEDRLKSDIIWHEMALRRLAAGQIEVTQQEIQERLDFEYGPKVQIREIVLNSKESADEIHRSATASPDQFGELAKQYSANPNSQAVKGLLPPIAMHSGDPELEKTIFAMQPGQISSVIQVADDQFIIIKCERIFPATEISDAQIALIQEKIVEQVSESKLATAATNLFKQLQDTVKIVNVLNDPEMAKKMPGVAALVDDVQIRTLFLAEECIARSGRDVLEAEISRSVLLQSLKQNNLQVTQEDISLEVQRAAESFGYKNADGSVDVQAWLTFVTKGDSKKIDFYVSDEVWPTVAMKKLVEGHVQVTDDDLQKGFEANFGPRVECLAIVFSDQRQALKVWKMASANLSEEYFGKLANQYSVEPASQGNFGQVPPIQKHGGRAELEAEAFALKPGELSKVVQVGEHYIILLCQGHTTPTVTDFAAVKEHLHRDILEKKLRIAMADEYEKMQQNSQIDNFLAGTSQSGKTEKMAAAQNDPNAQDNSQDRRR